MEAQDRVFDPGLHRLRSLTLAAKADGLLGRELESCDLLELHIGYGLDSPRGLEIGGTEESWTQDLKGIGRKLGKWFRSTDFIEIDGVKVTRIENVSNSHHTTAKTYTFSAITAKDPETLIEKDPVYTSDTHYPKIPESVDCPSGYSGITGASQTLEKRYATGE